MKSDVIDLKYLDAISTGILRVNNEGRVLFANKKAGQILDLPVGSEVNSDVDVSEWMITEFDGNPIKSEIVTFLDVNKKKAPVYEMDCAIQLPAGKTIYVSLNAAPILNDRDERKGTFISFEKVNDAELMDEEVQHSKIRFRRIFNSLLDEVHIWKFITNNQGELVDWELIEANSVALENWDKKLEEVSGKKASELFGEEAIDIFKPIVEEVFTKRVSVSWERYFPFAEQYLSMDSIPMGDYFISTGRDITERKKTEKELEKLSMVAKKTQDTVIITDSEGKIEWTNAAFEELTGYSSEEVLGKKPGEFLQGEKSDPETIRRISKAIDQRIPFNEELINYHKSGYPYYIIINATPIFDESGNFVRYFSIQQDITKLKKVQSELSESVARLKKAQQTAKIGDWEWNLDTGEIYWSEEVYRIYGRDPKKAPLNPEQITAYSSNPENLRECIQNALEEGISSTYEDEIISEDGIHKFVKVIGDAITDQNKNVIKIRGTVQDISERKKAEIESNKKEAHISRLTNSIEGIIMRYTQYPDSKGVIEYISEGCERIYQYSPKELQDDVTLIWNNIPEADVEGLSNSIQNSIESLNKWSHIFRYKRPDGNMIWLHGRGIPTKNRDGSTTFDTVVFDVTDIKKTEEENTILLQEVHHRVKNNLAIISGLLQLEEFQTEDEDLLLPLKRSRNRISSMAKVHELLYRGSNLTEVNLGEYIEDLVRVIRENMQLNQMIDVATDLEESYVNINTAVPLGLLLNELLTNSFKYAFVGRDKGNISIKLRRKEETDEFELLYSDDGIGFKEGKNFENYDTLGINLIQTLLSQLDAEYQVQTENGFSISFSFYARVKGSQAISNGKKKLFS